jgi:23S rRNA (cytosine1962-C5)-methyltransferase
MTEKTIKEKLNRAIAKRKPLFTPETNVFRLVNGDTEDLDDIVIDQFADVWLLQTAASNGLEFAQSIWNHLDNKPASFYWKALVQEGKTSPQYVAGEIVDTPFQVLENELKYRIDFQAGYSQGLFIDQRNNRKKIRNLVSKGKTVLNTFAYTCAFGVAAAAQEAETVNLDLSRHYLDWGKENYRINGINPANHGFIYGDVFDWLRCFAKKQRKFDVIILDPPTFSRNRSRNTSFRVDTDYPRLAAMAKELLNPGGTLLCCCNTHRLSQKEFSNLLRKGLGTTVSLSFDEPPPDFPGYHFLKSARILEWEKDI